MNSGRLHSYLIQAHSLRLLRIGGTEIVKRLFVLPLMIALAGSITGSAQAPRCTDAVDPVCGLCVKKDPKLSMAYKGETYYFCLTRDLDKFKANPAEYVKR